MKNILYTNIQINVPYFINGQNQNMFGLLCLYIVLIDNQILQN